VPAAGHPDGLADLFVDRSLGRRQVPDLLRSAGLRLRTLAEVYGIPADQDVDDITWLTYAGEQGWPVLMKDERIRYRPAETQAVLAHHVQAFCLTSGNLRAPEMATQILSAIDHIAAACQPPGPFLYTLSRAGLRPIMLG